MRESAGWLGVQKKAKAQADHYRQDEVPVEVIPGSDVMPRKGLSTT